MQLTTIVASTSFSMRILEALSSGDVDLLNQYGFLDEFDQRGLSVNDLQAIVPGSSSDVATLCVRIAALCKGPFASAAVSSAAAAPEALFSAPLVIQWKPGSSSKALISEDKSAIVEECWLIFVHMGQRGLWLSPLVLSQHDSARTVFCNSVARGETSSLKGHLAAWRRWKTFGRKFMPEPFDATHESSP